MQTTGSAPADAHSEGAVPADGKVETVFLRRQSPDWAALSRDHRRGETIDPRRYLPDHDIPGFPQNIGALISAWNERFATDFFTVRSLIAQISRSSIESVRGASAYTYEQIPQLANMARERQFYLCPHDDDDFFAPYLAEELAVAPRTTDAIVAPMFRVGRDNWTFVPDGCDPDEILASRRPQQYRYQTNNYAVHSRRLMSVEQIRAIKDHIQGSAYAQSQRFTDYVIPKVLSATLKTPASASVLPGTLRGWRGTRRMFKETVKSLENMRLSGKFEWITRPSLLVARMFTAIYAGKRLNSLTDIHP